jgi:hypothetical protein
LLGFMPRECRRRFVEDQHARSAEQCTRDLHELLLCNAQLGYKPGRLDIDTEMLLHGGARKAAHAGGAENRQEAEGRLVAEQ